MPDPPCARYICIHGHFYQPPRENPWLEAIEVQDSAYPYHDWNERINAECYAPNTASRILDPDFKIIDIVNNYSRISFNFGPTLLSWMENFAPETYAAIIDADVQSRKNFSGHGSAIAQVYNHMIMPLANLRDRVTQVRWGIADFVKRFGREPEGMWLAETAVDLLTLDILADHGIKFTILAPRQASRCRPIGTQEWQDASGEKIDTKMAYVCHLPSGRKINLFFYDGAISKDIAFGNLLVSGESFAHRINSAFTGGPNPQMVHIATDGETYGHHYKRADMALSYCMYDVESHGHAKITIYGEFLEKHPPSHEAEIFENTSWSCEHGIERWRSDCGCNTGAGWRQPWRAPLREDMDWLRDQLIPLYEKQMKAFTDDPWALRDDYINVVLDRTDALVEKFFTKNIRKVLKSEEKQKVLSLLEMQRNAMLMYTSCGWFFDEISGIETTQVMDYASRAMQIARILGVSLEDEYQKRLEKAPTNIPDFQNGAHVYEMFVKSTRLDLYRVLAHYAVSSLFSDYPNEFQVYAYRCSSKIYDRVEAGKLKLATGMTNIRSNVTWSELNLSFAVLHLGDFNISGGSRELSVEEDFRKMQTDVKGAFLSSDVPSTIRLMDKYLRDHEFSLWSLFRDEQRRILNLILSSTLESVEASFRQIFDTNYPIMNVMLTRRNPLPKALATTVEFVINRQLMDLLQADDINIAELERQVAEVSKWPIELDRAGLSIIARNSVRKQMNRLRETPLDLALWEKIEQMIKNLNKLKMDMGLWETQNIYFRIGKEFYSDMQAKAEKGDSTAAQWIEYFNRAGQDLGIKIS